MILTVTPNAVVDKTYQVENFALDRVNRPTEAFTVAGGKGINVARVYQTLGGRAIATGFLGGLQGRIVARALKAEGIADACVRIAGETRLCIAIVDPTTGTQTEVNERGPEVSRRAVTMLRKRVAELLSQHPFQFVVLSGSLPPGAPETLYAELIALARKAGVQTVLDSSGAALAEGIQAKPWLVKPNRTELESVLKQSLSEWDDVLRAGLELQRSGIETVVVTLGSEGALLFTANEIWTSVPPTIEFASAVASGDSFLAAFLWQWEQATPAVKAESALRVATGAGAANAAVIGAGFCTRESILELAERTSVVPIY